MSSETTPPQPAAVGNASKSPIVDKAISLFNATGQSSYECNIETLPLGFLSTNRVVSVLEKAIERLELLTLLDTTSPEERAARPLLPGGGATANAAGADNARSSSFAVRKAVMMPSSGEDMSRKTMREVNLALLAVANTQHTGRPTVAELVEERQRLERRYGELLRKTKQAKPSPNEPELDPSCFAAVEDTERAVVMEELKQTSRTLREHNKALFIQLKDNPHDADNWKKIGNERYELTQLLQSLVRELTTGYNTARLSVSTGGLQRINSKRQRFDNTESLGAESREATMSLTKNRFGSTIQMKRSTRVPSAPRVPLMSSFEKFAKLILDEQNAQRWADELLIKEKEMNQNVKQLQYDLKAEKALKEKDIAERRQQIEKLKVKLRLEKKQVKQQSEMVRAEVEASHEARQRSAREEERVVLDKIRGFEQEEHMENRVHADFKEHIIERTEAMDELANQWDRKNQSEIKRVEARKIDVEQMRQNCAERLEKALQDKEFEMQLKQQRDDERREEELQRTAAETQANLEYDAVSQIQSAIRAMFTRQALTVLKKKNKKKRKAEKTQTRQ
ncbi:flagellar associated protein [Trypanosoma rangeli]|uniref:Flagellar associated protein n=1 Tax=Trypanosoma rangeli TaxID=5698 RepID=A0A3R7NMF4_TRYRA|nr:flagellar associated protein [Trypanosoma rangeli]RNF08631.1 flagellar associated protein [Trypanosoma rangeli]|eukprot:RNF08631.1 flagellar associated protein [Trypanosoma rangeli]